MPGLPRPRQAAAHRQVRRAHPGRHPGRQAAAPARQGRRRRGRRPVRRPAGDGRASARRRCSSAAATTSCSTCRSRFAEAAMGAEIEVPTPDAQPRQGQGARRLRPRQAAARCAAAARPCRTSDKKGDLLVRLDLVVPQKLSRAQKDALEKFAALDGAHDLALRPLRQGVTAMASTDTTPKYMIGVAAQLVGMHPQTLRLYEARGLVTPRRTAGGTPPLLRRRPRAPAARHRARERARALAAGRRARARGSRTSVAALERRNARPRGQRSTQAGHAHRERGRRGAPLLPPRPRRVAEPGSEVVVHPRHGSRAAVPPDFPRYRSAPAEEVNRPHGLLEAHRQGPGGRAGRRRARPRPRQPGAHRSAPAARARLPRRTPSPTCILSGVRRRHARAARRRRGRAGEPAARLRHRHDAAARSRASPSAPSSTARRRRRSRSATTTSPTEHLLLALLEERGRSRELLEAQGANRDRVMEALRNLRGGQRVDRPERRGPLRRAAQVRARPHGDRPRPASSTPSSAATRRSGAWCRCSRAARRTTRS